MPCHRAPRTTQSRSGISAMRDYVVLWEEGKTLPTATEQVEALYKAPEKPNKPVGGNDDIPKKSYGETARSLHIQ